MRDLSPGSALNVVTISLRERARAVIAVAVAERADDVCAVEGALELLVHDPHDRQDIGALFDLSPLAEAVLTIALAPDLAPDLGAGFAFLAGDPSATRPSLALALTILDEYPILDLEVLDELSRNGLLHVRPRGTEPILTAPLVPTSGLVRHLLGAPALPAGVFEGEDIGVVIDGIGPGSPGKPIVPTGANGLVHLHGVDRTSLRESAAMMASDLSKSAVFVVGVGLDATLIEELAREATLRSAMVVIEDVDTAPPGVQLGALPQPIVHLGDSPRPPRVERALPVHTIQLFPLTSHERATVWSDVLPRDLVCEAERLGRRFRLSRSEIRAAVDQARSRAHQTGSGEPTLDEVTAGARAQTGADLDKLAPRVEVPQRWNDLVLTDDARAQLDELVSRVDQRSRVVDDWGFGDRRSVHPTTALFVGPAGTGKSMAAEAVAGRLGLALHRIDLSRVVSKYIGETEQQLEAIFEAASRTNAILFFDEADALFGKRSEVRDAHDRYANLEVSYLLQRMENYDGVAVLATNLAANMDEAFARRLDFTIHFPFPGPGARRLLWARAWPERTPLDDLDDTVRTISDTFELSGGNIRNIAVASAYLAAGNGGFVQASHVRHAVHRELQKLGTNVDAVEALAESR